MSFFNLPISTQVNKIIPKNAFDAYASLKYKKQLSNFVERFKWTNKLSLETLNLRGKEVKEIQIFEVALRNEGNLGPLFDIIDKAIPYPIIFQILKDDQYQLRISAKHLNPASENTAVIDWTFTSEWKKMDSPFTFVLEKNLDYVLFNACRNIIGGSLKIADLAELIQFEKQRNIFEKKIKRITVDLGKETQFNRKVALNISLNKTQKELQDWEASHRIDKAE